MSPKELFYYMMASECGVRCFSERKSYCRDLHKWSRNLLYMLGLECVAKELTGKRAWVQISPFIEESKKKKEPEPAVDWTPATVCPICTGKRCADTMNEDERGLPSASVVRREVEAACCEASGKSSSEQPRLNFDFLFGPGATSDPSSSMSAFGTGNPLYPPAFPFFGYGSSANYLNQLLWSAALNPSLYASHFLNPLGLNPSAALTSSMEPLVHHSKEKTLTPTTPGSAAVAAVVSSLSSTINRPRSSASSGHKDPDISIRTATAEEPLDLSKKVKVSPTEAFQPATPSGVEDFFASNGIPLTKPGNTGNQNGPVTKRNYSQVDLEKAVRDIRSGKLGTRRASVVYGIPRSTLRNKIYKLEAAEENGGAGTSTPAKKSRKSAVAISSSPIDASLKSEIKTEAESPSNDSASIDLSNGNNGIAQSDPTILTSQSPATVDRMSEEAKMFNPAKLFGPTAVDPSTWPSSLGDYWNSSYQMMATGMTPTALGKLWMDQLKDAKGLSPGVMGEQAKEELTHSNSSTPGSESPGKRRRGGKGGVRGTSEESGTESWRKSRPKRGQYRKYDKNALDEAVCTVRRGEMSVHRAGSYYGVPHSTLEYKVKERNLLRQKKKEEQKKAAVEGENAGSRRNSEDDGSSPNEQEKSPGDSKPKPNLSDTPTSSSSFTDSIKASTSATTTVEWPYGSAGNSGFFASDMMRRLKGATESSAANASSKEELGSHSGDRPSNPAQPVGCATQ